MLLNKADAYDIHHLYGPAALTLVSISYICTITWGSMHESRYESSRAGRVEMECSSFILARIRDDQIERDAYGTQANSLSFSLSYCGDFCVTALDERDGSGHRRNGWDAFQPLVPH